MQTLPILKYGDCVEIIAPASRASTERLSDLKELLSSWKLECLISENIFGEDLLCANSDEIRFEILKTALLRPETKAVICVTGGYGSMRLIPCLNKINPPLNPKIFIGMSDMTALNLFLQQQWQWPIIHGALIKKRFSPESIAALQSILFGQIDEIVLNGLPLNSAAEKNTHIEATVIGGNLSLVQTSIGTLWQMNARNKIIFLEEVRERGFRVDRMLQHLKQANIFNNAAAIMFGDFILGDEPNGTSLLAPVLKRFAEQSDIPVIQVQGVGHGFVNFPLLLGTKTKLQMGNKIKLVCSRWCEQ